MTGPAGSAEGPAAATPGRPAAHPGPPPVVAVVGPTATGKSDLAIALALALDGEVVNADAQQLYRGMDIGTAKVPPQQRAGVPHHLLDVWDVRTEASVAQYQALARAAVADIQARGRRPVLVGGSGLYVRAVLDRLEFPGTDPALRARLEAQAAAVGAGALHERLAAVDAPSAARIPASNVRRVVRALEVLELTGRPFSATLPDLGQDGVVPAVQIGLRMRRPVLDGRIAARVQAMWDAGLVDEVRALESAGLREGRTAARALGYAQVLRLLDGELDDAAARAETVQATRRFARRQESWFRRDPRVVWLEPDPAGPDGHGDALLRRALAVASVP